MPMNTQVIECSKAPDSDMPFAADREAGGSASLASLAKR